MHFELKNILKNVIKSSEFIEFLRKSYAINEDTFGPIVVEVSNCPKGIDAEIMSGITYALVKKIEQILGKEVNPSPIAARIIEIAERLSQSKSGKIFEFSIGGSGFINASPTKILFPLMIESFFENKWGIFFKPATMIFETSTIHESDLLDLKKQFEIIAYSQEQLANNSNEDVRLLMKARASHGFDKETALMCTALLADDEIDVYPYLNGVCGRQNVPWYIRRFNNDAEVYELELLKRFSIKEVDMKEEGLPKDITKACVLIKYFRHILFCALYEKRPEVFLRHIFEMMKAFYFFYNHPNWRDYRGDVTLYHLAFNVTQVLRKLVMGGLYVLDQLPEGIALDRNYAKT